MPNLSIPVSHKDVRCEVASMKALLVESNARCFADCFFMTYPKDDKRNAHLLRYKVLKLLVAPVTLCLAIVHFSYRWYA